MNPAIASLSEKWQVRGPQDGPAATYATFDSEGVYRLYVLTLSRLDEWLLRELERQVESVSHQGWWYDDQWGKVAA